MSNPQMDANSPPPPCSSNDCSVTAARYEVVKESLAKALVEVATYRGQWEEACDSTSELKAELTQLGEMADISIRRELDRIVKLETQLAERTAVQGVEASLAAVDKMIDAVVEGNEGYHYTAGEPAIETHAAEPPKGQRIAPCAQEHCAATVFGDTKKCFDHAGYDAYATSEPTASEPDVPDGWGMTTDGSGTWFQRGAWMVWLGGISGCWSAGCHRERVEFPTRAEAIAHAESHMPAATGGESL